MLIFVCLQEMTLDEYEAMMAEKQPKINKEAAKPKVSFVTCLCVCYCFSVAGTANCISAATLACIFLRAFGKINCTYVWTLHICIVQYVRQGSWTHSCMALGQLQYLFVRSWPAALTLI